MKDYLHTRKHKVLLSVPEHKFLSKSISQFPALSVALWCSAPFRCLLGWVHTEHNGRHHYQGRSLIPHSAGRSVVCFFDKSLSLGIMHQVWLRSIYPIAMTLNIHVKKHTHSQCKCGTMQDL